MPLEKACVMKGCTGIAMFGFGRASTDCARFACKTHRHMIWPALTPPGAVASGEGRYGSGEPARSSPPSSAQGALL